MSEQDMAYISKIRIILGLTSSTVGIDSEDSDFGSQPSAMHGLKMSVRCRFSNVVVMRVCGKEPWGPSGRRRSSKRVIMDERSL